jgi:hypothetical protein
MNDFAFAKMLDHKLFPVLKEHGNDKPILVFASTRKGMLLLAFSRDDHSLPDGRDRCAYDR